MTIAEMEEFEKKTQKHIMCNAPFVRVFKPKRHVKFFEGVYENIAHDPIHISNAQQLMDECKKNDVSSNYMKDMSGLFGAKENRWV
jgi:hypothetical protein